MAARYTGMLLAAFGLERSLGARGGTRRRRSPLGRPSAMRALRTREDLRIGLAGDLGQDVELASAVGHPDRDLRRSALLQRRPRGSRPAAGPWIRRPPEVNRFWPTYLVCRNVSKASAALSLLRMCSCCIAGGRGVGDLHLARITRAARDLADVHALLHADGPAVGVRSTPRILAQLHDVLSAETARDELAVQVPEGQTVRLAISRSGCVRCLYSRGSMSAIRWPRTR